MPSNALEPRKNKSRSFECRARSRSESPPRIWPPRVAATQSFASAAFFGAKRRITITSLRKPREGFSSRSSTPACLWHSVFLPATRSNRRSIALDSSTAIKVTKPRSMQSKWHSSFVNWLGILRGVTRTAARPDADMLPSGSIRLSAADKSTPLHYVLR